VLPTFLCQLGEILKITTIVDEFVTSVVDIIYATFAAFVFSLMLSVPARKLSPGSKLIRILNRSMKPETYLVLWTGLAIATTEYLTPDFAVQAGSPPHSNSAMFALLVVRCIACLVLVKITVWVVALILSSGDRSRRRIIQIIMPALLANMLVVVTGSGIVSIYFEAQSSAIERYPLEILTLVACVLPLTSVLQKYISKAFLKKDKKYKSVIARIAAFYLALIMCFAPIVGYGFTRDLQYNAMFRQLIDVTERLYNANTRCDLTKSDITVKSYLTWHGEAKGIVDTADIVVKNDGVIVGKGNEKREILLNIAEPTLVTFTATGRAADDDIKEFDELKDIEQNFGKLTERIGAGRFDCEIILVRGPFGLREEETKSLTSRSVRSFLRQIDGR
jgi:hypothetical protein